MGHQTSTDPNVFILPDLGEGVHEAEMISWKVKVGDTVAEHDILAEMETDKALVEVPSPRAGTIKILHGEEGEILNVGNPLVTYEGGPDAPTATTTERAPRASEGSSNGTASSQTEAEDEDAGTVVGAMSDSMAGMGGGDGKPLAAPAVRALAKRLGIDLARVPGTGIGGRITKKDVETFKSSGGATAPSKAPASAPEPAQKSVPDQTRRPMPSAPAQPAYQPQYQQPQYQQQPMPQMAPQMAPQQQIPMMGMGMPGMMPPMGYMMVPMPMPMPYGYGMPGMMPQQAAGVPQAPGFTPFPAGRPIPDPAQTAQPDSRVPFRGIRRKIAQSLRNSVDTAVHFMVCDEADITELDAFRKELAQQSGEKLSYLPFIARAVCRVIGANAGGRFGALNATVDDANDEIVQHGPVHLGIATDTDSGLMVPVIKNADTLDAVGMGRAIADTAKAARDRSIDRDRLMGSTFTISNVGSHAGKFATPVINYPEVAILAVGKAYDGVVVRDGQAVVGKVLPLSLACDHRVVDGASAALALAEIVQLLRDNPRSLA
ncbi:MAG: dihydrolipoamide acetyltransferase family protein [Planctomycetota bacterium]